VLRLNANVCTEDVISLIVNVVCKQTRGTERQKGLQRRPHGRMLCTIYYKSLMQNFNHFLLFAKF